MYFLYLNNSAGALDAIDARNQDFIMDLKNFCYDNFAD